ncbi:ATP synthase subunit I [Fodinibius salsisoli]|uniref:ATP synthase subunit I n=1 Tax=Fodinibius salsisoli TaxID=2820877 RepID=A0ABT3PIY9_9BACT|nr:ATP synthase subunit I [Fodinibius salsisoli]MCW9705850.1 ATP synthase subunit I [Fodinibius salsisoli]
MDTSYYILISLIAGLLLGTIYFMGLWYTVKKITGKGRPYLLVFCSFVIRISLVLFGFYLLVLLHWSYLILAFLTFLLTRQMIIHKIGKPANIIYE